jgi:hypothetical protein
VKTTRERSREPFNPLRQNNWQRSRKAELDFEARMKELDVDIFALETQDIQDARKHFAKDWTSKAYRVSDGGILLLIHRYDYSNAA